MYDALDVHGGSTGIPVWMTEPQWKKLLIAKQVKIPLNFLKELSMLLASQKYCSIESETFHGGQFNEEKETASAAAKAEVEQATSEGRNSSRVGSPASGIITKGT